MALYRHGSALPTRQLEIYVGNLLLRFIGPAFRIRLPLGHHACNNSPPQFLRNWLTYPHHPKTRTASSCKCYLMDLSRTIVDGLHRSVWAPAPMSGPLKPVIVWLFGG